jgi:membrane protein implicated in regulation of membrane protease activity
MSSITSSVKKLLMSPFYLLAFLIGGILQDSDLGNWAARRLGLQGDCTQSNFSGNGSDGLVGSVGEIKTAFEAADNNALLGKVFVRGEIWNAQMLVGASAPAVGHNVRIVEVNGLTLVVEPMSVV